MSFGKINKFDSLPIQSIERIIVKDGVKCDVYKFTGDSSRDLGIVSVAASCSTPRQRVLRGSRTTEGFVSGKGRLIVWDEAGQSAIYEYPDNETAQSVEVKRGEIMQWVAAADSSLVFSEVCEPPYEDGRFENLPD